MYMLCFYTTQKWTGIYLLCLGKVIIMYIDIIVGDRSAEGIYTLTIRSAISILSIAFTFKCFIIESLIFAVVYDPPKLTKRVEYCDNWKTWHGKIVEINAVHNYRSYSFSFFTGPDFSQCNQLTT